MRPTREGVSFDDAPSPAQLFELASCGIQRAKEYGKLRVPPRDRPHARAAVLPYLVSNKPLDEGLPYSTQSRQMALHVARTGFRSWSMHVISKNHFVYNDLPLGEDDYLQQSALIDTYGFRWNAQETTVAKRILRAYPVPTEGNDLVDLIEQFAVPDDFAAFWHVQNQFGQVTGDDLATLRESFGQYADDTYQFMG